jgi:uncharacterized membrane protein YfcA
MVELAWLALGVLGAGVVAGLLAGLFGIGGGAVIVPVLFEVFRILGVPQAVRMQLCVGTSLAIILPTAIRSYRAHQVRGFVLRGVVRSWAVSAVIGVAAGSALAAVAPPALLRGAFVAIAGAIAARFLFGSERWKIADELPGQAAMRVFGFAIGLVSSLVGISGGSPSTAVLTLYGKPIHNAVATATGIGVPITIAGAAGYVLAGLPQEALLPPLSLGFVSLIGVALIAPVSSIVAPFGARLGHGWPRRRLEIAFGLFLSAAALRFLVSLVVG